MKRQTKPITYLTGKISELSDAERSLVDTARAYCSNSYAPHSGFRVGAAALLSSGEVVGAANQESEVYPSGMCAERVLLYYIKAQYPQYKIVTIAIAAQGGETEEEIYPCGACVQTLLDVEKRQNQPIKLIFSGRETCTVVENAATLLPFKFRLTK